jgi:arginine decarboxylase-like protein
MIASPDSRSTNEDAQGLYEVNRWGNGCVSIVDYGNVPVHPERESRRSIDLKQLFNCSSMHVYTYPTQGRLAVRHWRI